MSKRNVLMAVCFGLLCVGKASAQKMVTEKVEVNGNCGMCRSKIQKAATEAGATKASWNKKTHLLTVTYEEGKTDLKKIEAAVAENGYDTKDIAATDQAYNKLNGCCQYKRKKQG